jgi:hypothetical protein
MSIYQPYCYLIGWSSTNKYYYGVRYAKSANPSDLWKKYFTSSKIVKLYRKKHGDPDIIQVRKIFQTAHEAVLFEQKVLRRLNVEKNDKWLNTKNSTTSVPIMCPNSTSFKKGSIPWNKGLKSNLSLEERKIKHGRKKTEEEKKKSSKKRKDWFLENSERKEALRIKALNQFKNVQTQQKHLNNFLKANGNHVGTIWINDGTKSKRIDVHELDIYISSGWVKGRIRSEMKCINHNERIRCSITGKFMKKEIK